MKKTLLFTVGLLFAGFGFAQKSKFTIYNQRGYKTQTGYLVNGYKEGQWIKINSRGDTTLAIYTKDKETFSQRKTKKRYGDYKDKMLVTSIYTDIRKTAKSTYNIVTHEDEIYSLEKNITCPYYSKPYYEYRVIGDKKTIKTIVQKLDLGMALYPLKDHFGTKYDKQLKKHLPNYSKIVFSVSPEYGYRQISDLSIYYENIKIEQRPDGEFFMVKNDRYELLTSVNYFFQEKSAIQLKKNGTVMFEQQFYKGIPVSFVSYFDNGQKKVQLYFKNGLPHGDFQTFYENGNNKISCTFNEGTLESDFDYYEEDKSVKYKAYLNQGKIDGLVTGKTTALLFRDGYVQQLVEVDENGNIKKWTSGYNKYSINGNKDDLRADGVKYLFDREKERFERFNIHSGETSFSYSDYGKQGMILINYHENKDNFFSLYIKKDGTIKDNINLTYKGENLRGNSKKDKLKLINKKFFKVSKLSYPDVVRIEKTSIGDTIVRSVFYPNGVMCLREKFLNGKLSGKRFMWGLKGNLIQEVNYKENHNEGFLVTYDSEGEIKEAGVFESGVKNGKWIKIDKGIRYEFIHFNSNKADYTKTYYANGKLRTDYKVSDSGNYSVSFNEDGTKKSEYYRNKNRKYHGYYFNTWGKGKSVKGNYLNGFKHGEFNYYNEEGKLESVKYYEYGIETNKKQKGNGLNSSCECPKEFNVLNGSSFFPTLKDFISYNSFNSMFPGVFESPESSYSRIFVRRVNNSFSRNNSIRFIGADWIVFPSSNTFYLPQYKDIQLVITPCAKTGELAYRKVTLNTTHPLVRYSCNFEEGDVFEITSKNLYQLMVDMINEDVEDFLENSHRDMASLSSLIKYLNKNGFKITKSKEYDEQLETMLEYLRKEKKEEEFFKLFYLKEFNFGKLNKVNNINTYNAFNTNASKYFGSLLRDISIKYLEDNIIKIDARMTMDGGRYAFKHPLLIFEEKVTPVFFNCKSITVKEEIVFTDIKDICIEPKTVIKGTNIEINKINAMSNSSYTKAMTWNCTGKYKGIKKEINFSISWKKEGCEIKIAKESLTKDDIDYIKREVGKVKANSAIIIVVS